MLRQRTAISTAIVVLISIVVIAAAAIGIAVATIRPNSGGSTTSLSQTITSTGSTSSETTDLLRSGPISQYPAAWGLYSSCPGFSTQGNTTTLSNLSIVTYPNSWNTTSIVTLDQVYTSIINSPAFASTTSGYGWVVYSWSFDQGGSTNMPPNSNDIVGYFILTNATSPNGYVTAYYDIQNDSVAVSSLTTTVTVDCPSFSTSGTTTTDSS
jgi:hypothetical protein